MDNSRLSKYNGCAIRSREGSQPKMELNNLISTSDTVDIYKVGNMAVKLFKEGTAKTAALYEALTHSRVEATGLRVPVIH